MDQLRERLAFLTDWIPDDIRSWAAVEVWWLALLVVALLALLLVGTLLKAVLRALFRRKRKKEEWEPELREDLPSCPMPNAKPAASVYHVPARLRLVVVAPAGKGFEIDPATIAEALDRAVPGLGKLARHDRPRIVLWPAPVSPLGFASSFHRATPTDEGRDDPSRWIMLAGRAKGGGQALFVGLALWTDEPTTLGRRNLEAGEWLEVLRLGGGS
ncbi:MAG: hypothetical protein K2W96_09490 [Gemmataceae bacterium]|nr:hypothetical protein [Gemmataceae bacterium]